MYLACQKKDYLTSTREICDVYRLSANHVNKVVHHLSKLNLIHTKRGKNGGFMLAMEPGQIKLDYVIRQLEGDEPWIDCHSPYCIAVPACELRHIVGQGKELFYQHLANYSVTDLVRNNNEKLREIFRQPATA